MRDDEQGFPGSSRAGGGADGARARGRARLALGGAVVDFDDDRLHGQDVATLDEARRSRRLKALERENREHRQAGLREALAHFARAELDRRFKP